MSVVVILYCSCDYNYEVGYDSSVSQPNPDRTPRDTPLVTKNIKDLRQNPGYVNVHIFTHDEMRLATKNFRPDLILGEGGFGIVYKGVIDDTVRPGYTATQVAIKELNPEGYQGDREWLVFDLSFTLFFINFHRNHALQYYVVQYLLCTDQEYEISSLKTK